MEGYPDRLKGKAKSSSLDKIISDVDYRFDIKIGNSVHRFRCATEEDMWTWIISVRTCVEDAWVQLVQKEQNISQPDEEMSSVSDLQVDLLTKESLNTSAKIGVRTEGPMKVVELDEEIISKAESAALLKQSSKGADNRSTSASSVSRTVAAGPGGSSVVASGLDDSTHSNSSDNSTCF